MSLATNLQDAFTRIGTEFKAVRVLISGSGTGDTAGLSTTSKNLVGAVNEVKALVGAGSPTTLSDLTDAEVTTPAAGHMLRHNGTDGFVNVDPTTYLQPRDTDLDAIASLTTTAYGRAFLALANQAGLAALLPAASETVSGISEVATQVETNTGTDDVRSVTPLKLQTRLAAYAQPVDTDLTAIAALSTTVFGRSLLTMADASATKTALGLSAVATSGSASDITTGTLPTSVLPPLAINETYTVATQAAMLALTAQRGDAAIRTDINRMFFLATDSPATLADWKQVNAGGDVLSVAGKTGAVTLAKADVGLGSVDNTADTAKPVSTAQQTALNLKMDKSANLSDVANAATARTNLSVYSQADIGSPTTNFVTTFETALA